MGGIVCAVRGGPGSQATVSEAIALAKRTGEALHFVYVVNLDFLARTTTSRTEVIGQQMREMGEALLLPALDKAQAAGLLAEKVVRHGDVVEEIASYCHELDAHYLVLGTPNPAKEDNVFTEMRLTEFITRMEAQTGAKVIVTRREAS